jgi:hypothetical protein
VRGQVDEDMFVYQVECNPATERVVMVFYCDGPSWDRFDTRSYTLAERSIIFGSI